MRTWAVRLLLAVIATALGGGSSLADRTVIDFEDIDVGRNARQELTEQYAARGITFNRVTLLVYSGGVAHGTRAIEQCWGVEFCSTPFEMTFPSAVSEVRVRVGYSGPLREAAPIVMEAFGAANERLTATRLVLPSSPNAIPADRELTVTASGIRRVTVANGTPNGFTNGIVLDDIEFVTPVADLAVARVKASRGSNGRGLLSIQLENRGDAPSAPAEVVARSSAAPNATVELQALQPGQSASVRLEVAVPANQTGVIEVVVDPRRVLPDGDRSNNDGSAELAAVSPTPPSPTPLNPSPTAGESPRQPWPLFPIAVVVVLVAAATVWALTHGKGGQRTSDQGSFRWQGVTDAGRQYLTVKEHGPGASIRFAVIPDAGRQVLRTKQAGGTP